MSIIRIEEYLDPNGKSAYGRWFDKLNVHAAAKVTAALYRLGEGNFPV